MGLSGDVVLRRVVLQRLVAQGVRGVTLVIGDAHPGLGQAIKEVFLERPGNAFPTTVLCLFGALLAAQNDEWSVADHRYRSETAMHKLVIQAEEEVPAQLEQWTA